MSDQATSSQNATNTSQTQSSLRGPAMRGSSLDAESNGAHLPEQVMAKRCLDIVKDFRSSKVTKFDAIYTISCNVRESLPGDSGEDPATVAAIYLTMLDEWVGNDMGIPMDTHDIAYEWESEEDHARQRRAGTVRERRSDEPTSTSHREEVTSAQTVRSREATPEPGELTRKRAKLNFSSLDLKPDVLEEPARPISANLKRTIRILQNWAQDQKQAKLMLMYHERSPEFYESGWADIVAGRSLNLDAIHTIITTSRSVDKHRESIGDVEFTYGVAETSTKRIATQHHWNAAWNRAARALKFAFPY
ncbi:uncharacterized protein HD556DRAFT_1463491 [Suillus plorans]|uniref:Uncharacterized protein n=1 Tax=Suillus plorans TaxID=116603 RepID=A0A9P7DLV3_9AGAM|nr:uncharacterized protein HD556DRAFT_1463491 [Suillus plorans]KAG1798085.1 hypothetical protein HD556DRAFT_1463491 [Suillus plorans]